MNRSPRVQTEWLTARPSLARAGRRPWPLAAGLLVAGSLALTAVIGVLDARTTETTRSTRAALAGLDEALREARPASRKEPAALRQKQLDAAHLLMARYGFRPADLRIDRSASLVHAQYTLAAEPLAAFITALAEVDPPVMELSLLRAAMSRGDSPAFRASLTAPADSSQSPAPPPAVAPPRAAPSSRSASDGNGAGPRVDSGALVRLLGTRPPAEPAESPAAPEPAREAPTLPAGTGKAQEEPQPTQSLIGTITIGDTRYRCYKAPGTKFPLVESSPQCLGETER